VGSVLQLADDFRTRFDRLDVLVNNAGAYFVERQVTSEGLEMTFALNHLSYFLLTDRMLELLQASGPGRIVNVSSQAHSNASLDFDDLQHERQYDGWKTYCESKLMNLYFTFELARRLKGGRVVVNALHPGLVATGFGHNNPNPPAWLQRAQRNAISPEQGAETMIYLAASPAVQGVSGQYFYQKKVAESSQTSKDGEAARRLWEISAQMVGDFR
jgi:NAD(P)-dependent dehydrogenase (short-subunit alcohol dehydrogenase family)